MISFFQNNWIRATPAAGLVSTALRCMRAVVPVVCEREYTGLVPIPDDSAAATSDLVDCSYALFSKRSGQGLKGGGRRSSARYVFCIVCHWSAVRILTVCALDSTAAAAAGGGEAPTYVGRARPLHNYSADCYQNVVLQVLFRLFTPSAVNLLCCDMNGVPVSAAVPNSQLAEALMQTMVGIATTNPPWQVYDPSPFVKTAKGQLKFFRGSRQHDSSEFFIKTMMKLPNLAQLFYGTTTESLRCTSCDFAWVREAETVLTVDLAITGLGTLHQCLERNDVSEEVVCTCERCKHEQARKSQHLIYGPHVPFVLRRFGNKGKKDTHLVRYTHTLMLPSRPAGEVKPYDLTAVVCHLGQAAGGGHFICYVSGENDTCVRLDDYRAAVPLPVDSMLDLESAYLLFYSVC